VEQDQSQSRKDYEQNNEQRHTLWLPNKLLVSCAFRRKSSLAGALFHFDKQLQWKKIFK